MCIQRSTFRAEASFKRKKKSASAKKLKALYNLVPSVIPKEGLGLVVNVNFVRNIKPTVITYCYCPLYPFLCSAIVPSIRVRGIPHLSTYTFLATLPLLQLSHKIKLHYYFLLDSNVNLIAFTLLLTIKLEPLVIQ